MLQAYADAYGYNVQVVQKLQHHGRDISSTYIREEIEKGHMELAQKMLGYPYFIQGTVVHGRQIGRDIGFPTINILPPGHKLLPPLGVYVSRVDLGGRLYGGITNIGKKPTIEGKHPLSAETFIFGFHGDLYGKKVKVELLHFKRPEIQFGGLVQLKQQIQEDLEYGQRYLRDIQ